MSSFIRHFNGNEKNVFIAIKVEYIKHIYIYIKLGLLLVNYMTAIPFKIVNGYYL